MSVYLDHVNNNISASTGNLTINGVVPQTQNDNLTSLAALSIVSTGLVKLTNGVASLDTSNYLVSSGALGTPASGDLVNAINAVAYGIKTATNTVSVSASVAPTAGQALVATSPNTATWQTVSAGGGGGGSSGLNPTTIKISAYTAIPYDLVRCNTTTAPFTVTLPASPTDGDIVGILDVNNSFGTNNLTLLPNGNTIEGDTISAILDISGTYLTLIYNAANTNWKMLITPLSTSSSTSSTSSSSGFENTFLFMGV